MSITLPVGVATAFEAEVKHAYQAEGGMLRNTVRTKVLTNAKTHTFNKMGKGQATERGALQTQIPVMDVAHTRVTVTLKNYTASDLTDIFANEHTPVDERLEFASVIAKALGRREDQLIIDALNASSTSNTIADDISGSTDNFTLAALREAKRFLDTNNVPATERTMLIHANGLHHLLADTTVTSADFNAVRALVSGELNSFYGFNFISLGDMAEGGLPKSTNARTSFAYHKFAVGYAMNLEKVTLDWEPSYGAWRSTGWLSANAVAVDDEGIVKITTDES